MSLRDQITKVRAMQRADADDRWLVETPIVGANQDLHQGVNSTYRLQLPDGTEGFFKPVEGAHRFNAACYGHTREQTILNECAAWQLAKRLGHPFDQLVPRTVLRSWTDPHTGEEMHGAFSEKVEGREWDMDSPIVKAPGLVFDSAMFDSLIANQDRHPGNYLWNEPDQLHLIDHGYAFARSGDVLQNAYFIDWRHRSGMTMLSDVERAALGHLQLSGDLRDVCEILLPQNASYLVARCEQMLTTGRILDYGDFGPDLVHPQPGAHAEVHPQLDPDVLEAVRLARAGQPRPASDALLPRTDANPSTTAASRPPRSPSQQRRTAR